MEDSNEKRLAALDAAIRRGLADAAAGRTKPAEEVFDRQEARLQALRIARSPHEEEDQAFQEQDGERQARASGAGSEHRDGND